MRLATLRQLRLIVPAQAGRPAYVSAASGLVKAGQHFYVVADDELQLAVFECNSDAPGTLVRLLAGELPPAARERKAGKPDFEALTFVPSFADYPAGALLALGSGSRRERRQAVLLRLTESAVNSSSARRLDASRLFDAMASEVDDMNVEGAVVIDDRLVLMHRGNARHPSCALVSFELRQLLRSIDDDDRLGRVHIESVRHYDLGKIDDAPLTFTDAAVLRDGAILFSAVAEQTDDNYADGPCRGAALGEIGPDGNLRRIEYVEGGYKIEGVHAAADGASCRLWAVTDADDVDVPATLLTGEWCS
jgi:uncharacterized protein DUF6929